MENSRPDDRIDFVVGSEIRLKDILGSAGAGPLLKELLSLGAQGAAITDAAGQFLWSEGFIAGDKAIRPSVMRDVAKGKLRGEDWQIAPLSHEGEPVGYLFIGISRPDEPAALLKIAAVSLNSIINNAVKRMLTTELHTAVVQQSYEELLEVNKRLSSSEKKYRELAQTLEQKVEERTAELKKAHMKLLQREKMASVGQLAAGIAHEINTPLGFIHSNLNTLAKYINNFVEMLRFHQKLLDGLSANDPLVKETEDLKRRLKIDFIKEDIRSLISQSLDGSGRIKQIVANMKDFSHIDEAAAGEIDINNELDKVLSVLSHEIKKRGAEIVKEYTQIPALYGNPGLLGQVFLNVIINALQSKDNGVRITVRTEQRGDSAVISIRDNGKGIPAAIQDRIFEPFFTTKQVGEGTGMGLTVAYDIVSSHNGALEVHSEEGKGSTFIITLPIRRSEDGKIC